MEDLSRLNDPRMEYYHSVYKNSKRYDGSPLDGKTIIVYCEQGFGDIIQFSRYFQFLKNCKVILHCPKPLHRLFKQFNFELVDKDDNNIPDHDFHILSFSLPFYFNKKVKFPYLNIKKKVDLSEFKEPKIGIAWEGNPSNQYNDRRSCHMSFFKHLATNYKLFLLNREIHDKTLICHDFELFSIKIEDFYDTATLINAVDFVICVDTAVLHLAGALNKKTFGLLSYRHDERWDVKKWYDSVQLITQKTEGNWKDVFNSINNLCNLRNGY